MALLGILGSIIGLEGYTSNNDKPQIEFEFITKLHNLKIGIQPLKKTCFAPVKSSDFSIKYETFEKFSCSYNNFHGYGSYETGGNLVVTEQILIDPAFRIFLYKGECEKEVFNKINEKLSNNLAYFLPYMGKNEFPISIIYEGSSNYYIPDENPEYLKINSFICSDLVEFDSFGSTSCQLFWYPNEFINSQYSFLKMIFGDMTIKLKQDIMDNRKYIIAKSNSSDEYVFLF